MLQNEISQLRDEVKMLRELMLGMQKDMVVMKQSNENHHSIYFIFANIFFLFL